MTLLHVEDLRAGYGSAQVLFDVKFSIKAGEAVGLLGRNGMGKTTTVKAIMGLLRPDAGRVAFRGLDITGAAPYQVAQAGIGLVPEGRQIFPTLTVEENLRLGVSNDRMLADGLDLITTHFPIIPERFKQKAGTLSGGEQRMLLVSRALISQPRLMLIDEISEGLQPTMVERVANVLKTARRDLGVTILLVEQNLDFALSIADRYAVLKLGEIVDRGNISDDNAKNQIRTYLQV